MRYTPLIAMACAMCRMGVSCNAKQRRKALFFLECFMSRIRLRLAALNWVVAVLLAACQGSAPPDPGAQQGERVPIDLPEAWGGQVRCSKAQGCLLAAVEHERGRLVVHRLQGRASSLLASHPLAYHPDSAVWLSDDVVAAAVEATGSMDFFRLQNQELIPLAQVSVGFSPRDLLLVREQAGTYRLLATPYSGDAVTWVNWSESTATAGVQTARWCQAPWHPVRVDRTPQGAGAGIAVACLDDKRVIVAGDDAASAAPRVLAQFSVVPRQVRPSPSGLWLYVALETGGRNARIQMDTGELQWIDGAPTGAVSVAALSDDLVVWGDSGRLTLQRLDSKAGVLQARTLAVSGFATSLQVLDVDGDGVLDLVVLNSSGKQSDVIYGPLWDLAKPIN